MEITQKKGSALKRGGHKRPNSSFAVGHLSPRNSALIGHDAREAQRCFGQRTNYAYEVFAWISGRNTRIIFREPFSAAPELLKDVARNLQVLKAGGGKL